MQNDRKRSENQIIEIRKREEQWELRQSKKQKIVTKLNENAKTQK